MMAACQAAAMFEIRSVSLATLLLPIQLCLLQMMPPAFSAPTSEALQMAQKISSLTT